MRNHLHRGAVTNRYLGMRQRQPWPNPFEQLLHTLHTHWRQGRPYKGSIHPQAFKITERQFLIGC